MEISRTHKNKNNEGFTLTELVVVVAGLAILSSLSIPNILGRIKLNKVEEVKALMNGYIVDCMSKYRTATSYEKDFKDKATPYDLSNEKLATLDYKINKGKCSEVELTPLNESDKDLFPLAFEIGFDGRVFKRGTPPKPTRTNPPFKKSCENWAGKNCGMSEEDKAEYERLKLLEQQRSECIQTYNAWLSSGGTGQNRTWDSSSETCDRPVFAFEGNPVNSMDAVYQAEIAKYGRECLDWRSKQMTAKRISPNGDPETIKACRGDNYWFHSGEEMTTQAEWNNYDDRLKEQACLDDRENALKQKKSGEYTYGPGLRPEPCGTTKYLCDGKEYPSLDAYRNTKCGAVPDEEELERIRKEKEEQERAKRCANFRPHGYCKGRPNMRNHPMCKCQ